MKYFSISSVQEAYKQISVSTKEKFWGILGILHSINETIYPNKYYSVESGILSQYFEDLFRLFNKKQYSGNDVYSFIFSTHWVDSLSTDYLVGKPNIEHILVWAYRNNPFATELTIAELFNKFLHDYHITKETAERLFKLSFSGKLDFSEDRYSDNDLLLNLGNTQDSRKATLKLDNTFVVANAGDLSRGPYFQPLYASLQTLKCVTIYPFNMYDYYNLVDDESQIDGHSKCNDNSYNKSLQQIFYGAPGTGKSNKIKQIVDNQGKKHFRTTFHPDSDYATFVGCYKPIMKPTGVTLASGEKEEIIKYSFVPQAFTKAYTAAWNTEEEVYLIIEEINRGNCAQIFGDLFQLLDRKDGASEYPINADSDLADYIKEELKDSPRSDIPEEVKNGSKLMLPLNLYIWATMNTSDQSLFPIDSAFKRRWDWKYIPIKKHDEEYKISVGTATYDWWKFLEKINKVISERTSSEDKQLGYFFVKAENKIIEADKFVGKVLFYLWNDVFKNYGFDHPIFKKDDNNNFTFSDFFDEKGDPDAENVNKFLRKLDETIDKEIPFEEKKGNSAEDVNNAQTEATGA